MELFKLFGTIAINNDEANRDIDETTGRAEEAESRMSSAFKKIGSAVAAAFAVDKIIEFGKSITEAAATVAAEQSAFEQIMGEYSDIAQDKVNEIADATGMVSTRLTPYMTSMTAKFKGLGYGIDDATNLAQDGLTLAADAAAFWDKSLDDSMSALNSFINGSYEGGEAIGLFANDTQLASYAVKEGIVSEAKEWSALDEAKKQATRLQYAEDMMKASGATGQAAKEAEQYANVQANLTEKWRQFKAQIGEPVLQNIVLPAMEKVSSVVDYLSTTVFPKLQSVGSEIGTFWKESLAPAFETVWEAIKKVVDAISPAIAPFTDFATSVKDNIQPMELFREACSALEDAVIWVSEKLTNFSQWATENPEKIKAITAVIVALVSAFAAYKAILIATNTWQKIVSATTKIVTGVQAALNAVMAANPITIIIVAIAALVAAFIYLWNNCEGFREFWINLWDKIKEIAKAVADWFKQAWTDIGNFFTVTVPGWFNSFKEFFVNLWNGISEFFSGIWEGIKNVINFAIMFIGNLLQAAFDIITLPFRFIWENCKDTIIEIWNAIVEFLTGIWDTIKEAITTAFEAIKNVVTTVFDAIKTFVETVWNAIVDFLTPIFEKIKNAVSTAWNAIKDTVITVFNAVKDFISNVWNGIKTTITNVVNGIKDVVSNVFNSVKSTVSSIFDSIKTKATNVWNGIKTAIETPINKAKETVKKGLDAIKGFFDKLKIKFPDIKLPHFSIKGSFSLNPPSVPKLSIDWYKKAMDNAMVLNSPTIFGVNNSGQLMGGGEAGQEVVSGSNTLMGMIRSAVQSELSEIGDGFERLISILDYYLPDIASNSGKQLVLDTGVLAGELAPKMDSRLGNLNKLRERGR